MMPYGFLLPPTKDLPVIKGPQLDPSQNPSPEIQMAVKRPEPRESEQVEIRLMGNPLKESGQAEKGVR